MCNIWKIPESVPDLSLEEWKRILASDLLVDLRELDLTGGEPFLRDDLPELIEHACLLKQTTLPRLRSVAITTNGVLSQRVLDDVERLLAPTGKTGLELVLVCALDAVGEEHDRIRRRPGAWRAADRTITGLLELRRHAPHLILGLKTTVLPQNLDQLEGISAYAAERGLFTIVSPAIVTAGRYLNTDLAAQLSLSPVQREVLACFYETHAADWSFHTESLARFLRTGRMRRPCTCGYNYLFVRSNGEVYLCPLLAEPVGNASSASLAACLLSEPAQRLRGQIGHRPECATCTEPGLERYALPYEGFAYLRFLFRHGAHSALPFHRHLGLDKYL